MSINLDIRLKRANKIYHEGVSNFNDNLYFYYLCIIDKIYNQLIYRLYALGKNCWFNFTPNKFRC